MDNTMIIVIGAIVIAGLSFGYYIVTQLRELHLSMNSRLDALLSVTKQLARAEGYKAGQDEMQQLRDFEESK